MLDNLSPRRRRFVLVLALAVAVGLGAAVLAALPDRVVTGSTRAVLVVPGYGGDAGSVSSLVDAVRRSGRTAYAVQLPGDGTGDIRASARHLDREARRLAGGRVDVVGFSAGGVVARVWLAEFGDRAARAVTIGSPHHGTTLIERIAGVTPEQCTGACAQLRPGSGLLNELNRGDETPGDAEWLTIWTADDETVTPPASARLAGATDVRVQDLCPGRRVTHGGLIRDPAVLAVVVAFLDGRALPETCPA